MGEEDYGEMVDVLEGQRRGRDNSSVDDARKESVSSAFEIQRHCLRYTYPLAVVDMGLKSVRPDSTKCRRTSDQSSRISHEMREGESTSTGMTWLISPHWMRITAQPMPPLLRQRSSRLRISSPTSGSLSVTYERGTMCVALTVNLHVR